MSDPLSVIGLAAGLVSLGIQVSSGITKYLDALDCRGQDIASVRQQNKALEKSLAFISATLAQPSNQPEHDGSAVLRECLESCNMELKALNSLVADLADSGESTAGMRGRIKNQRKKLLYPFNRPKLEQLDRRLCRANQTLQLPLQTLSV
ncbi:hypothetical protein MMYC01_204118 [Madurella mycetomatis]|uniref:Fungal N-terminal domain-containing protein n=1 Tax=Madurella mycetomatis TaxID=100816 RepID=A0A175WBX0_9PEZI|nr:hypothetical protein MMYC01_204099 [Madurella mycetomatis]KXX81123.1 hypothetical protein MMYC01_204118 [Madurella mycetomatis]